MANNDTQGTVIAACELYQLFPDLVPYAPDGRLDRPENYYQIIGLKPLVPASRITAAFLRRTRNFLAQSDRPGKKEEYRLIVDAGFILRKARLRLSHDLVLARHWLVETEAITADGSLEKPVAVAVAAQMEITKQQTYTVPRIVALMQESNIIGATEVQAIMAQKKVDPGAPVEQLILNSGYVSIQELNSLKLAEKLLNEKKITMAQFQVAIYDERTAGIRMAESLQVRGWLPVEVNRRQEDKNP